MHVEVRYLATGLCQSLLTSNAKNESQTPIAVSTFNVRSFSEAKGVCINMGVECLGNHVQCAMREWYTTKTETTVLFAVSPYANPTQLP